MTRYQVPCKLWVRWMHGEWFPACCSGPSNSSQNDNWLNSLGEEAKIKMLRVQHRVPRTANMFRYFQTTKAKLPNDKTKQLRSDLWHPPPDKQALIVKTQTIIMNLCKKPYMVICTSLTNHRSESKNAHCDSQCPHLRGCRCNYRSRRRLKISSWFLPTVAAGRSLGSSKKNKICTYTIIYIYLHKDI